MDCKGLHDKNRPPQSHNKDSNKNQIQDSLIVWWWHVIHAKHIGRHYDP